MSAIKIEQVTKTFPLADRPAVMGLDLQVEEGEIISLLGPSGCGKTTTLRLIAGFERPEQGTISLAGKPVVKQGSFVPPERRNIGMVFQDYALFPHLTVESNVKFGCKRDCGQLVSELLHLVGLEDHIRKYPHELSGGQQQRVALARALAQQPLVVLLDEPFSNLDTELKGQMRLETKRIIKQVGATAIFVTHDHQDAFAISDRVVVMSQGQIAQVGTPRQIVAEPATSFVAAFVGRANLLPGRVADNGLTLLTPIGPIAGMSVDKLVPGSKAFAAISPDAIQLTEQGNLEATVEQLVYTGDKVEVTLNAGDLDSGEYRLLFYGPVDIALSEHQTVRFSLRPDKIRLLAA